MTPTRFIAILALLFVAVAPFAAAQTCSPIHIVWPDADEPIWELTALPPSLSTPSWPGSGLEVRDVRYRGISVLKRGHVPMINVKYDHGTCFRDWATANTRFDAANQTAACFAEPMPGTVQTVCDTGVGMPDVGTFQGIAMEDFGEGFTLTTQSQAGWYRYTIKWTFERDGTIRPEFGFSHTSNSMANNPRRHHIYWRLDFDIDTPENNYAVVSREGGPWEAINVETTQIWDDPDANGGSLIAPTTWGIFNHHTGRGYTLTPGTKEYLAPSNPGTGNPEIDNFAREDIAISRYREGQLYDGNPSCSVNFFHGSNPIIQQEDISDADIVFWYRTGVRRLGGNGPEAPDTCEPLGPVIRPVGEWGGDVVGTDPDPSESQFALEAFPNPFGGSTTIRLRLDEAQDVRVMLYDIAGREVRVLHDGPLDASAHDLTLEAGSLPNGVYTVRVSGSAGADATRRIILVR